MKLVKTMTLFTLKVFAALIAISIALGVINMGIMYIVTDGFTNIY